jgi:hypothetical protein
MDVQQGLGKGAAAVPDLGRVGSAASIPGGYDPAGAEGSGSPVTGWQVRKQSLHHSVSP